MWLPQVVQLSLLLYILSSTASFTYASITFNLLNGTISAPAQTSFTALPTTLLEPLQTLEIGEFSYTIPGSNPIQKIQGRFNTHSPIDPADLQVLFEELKFRLTVEIDLFGDKPLVPEENPYAVEVAGCYSTTKAISTGSVVEMTYSQILATVEGLERLMVPLDKLFAVKYLFLQSNGNRYEVLGHGEVRRAY